MKSKAFDIMSVMNLVKEKANNCSSVWEKIKDNKPVLQKWYRKLHKTPDGWHQARINYIRSLSVWSVICDFIDLGDRHLENIMIDKSTGEVAHIDFELLFGQGKKLGVPDIIPFRLTNNMAAALDTMEDEGAFFSIAVSALKALCTHAKSFYMYLQIFEKMKTSTAASQASMKLANYFSEYKNEFLARMEKISLNIPMFWMEKIKAARCQDNLKQMYVGWAPWI
jgi:serine/threonine-protein kinase ATR